MHDPHDERGHVLELFGPDRLTDAELLTLALGAGSKRRTRLHRLVHELCPLWKLFGRGQHELRALGLSAVEAQRLLAAVELGRRVTRTVPDRRALLAPEDAYRCVAGELEHLEREQFIVVVLDVRNRPRHIACVATGSIDHCSVDPREVFAPAVRERASAVLLAHNHPSGDPTPSREDVTLTARLTQAGELLGVPVLDHIIVASAFEGVEHAPRFVSMAERGLIARREKAR